MRRAQTETFTIKLSLHCESWQQDYLDKLFRVGNSLYNCLVSDRKNALFEMTKTKEWRFVQNELSQLYADINNNAPTTKQKEALAILHARRNNILKSHGFNEYAFMRRMRKWREHQKSLIHSQVAQKIASSVWKQFEAHLYGPRSDIHFKRNHDFLSLEGKSNFTGIRFIKLSEKMVLRFNKVDIPVLMPNNAYVQESLQSRVKYCRIVRIPWRGKHQ